MIAEVVKYKNGSKRIRVEFLGVDFFDTDEYIIKTIENGFSISKPNLDYIGKTCKITRINDNYISISIVKDIQDGTYVLDEESDEDVSIFINRDYLEK